MTDEPDIAAAVKMAHAVMYHNQIDAPSLREKTIAHALLALHERGGRTPGTGEHCVACGQKRQAFNESGCGDPDDPGPCPPWPPTAAGEGE